MILDLLGFWATFVNSFIFPFSLMSPTLVDVMTITRLPINGEKLPTLFAISIEDLGIHFSKSGASYSKFLTTNAKSRSVVSDGEYHAFLLYWLCKYFVCNNFVTMVSEYSYYVVAIASSKSLAWLF